MCGTESITWHILKRPKNDCPDRNFRLPVLRQDREMQEREKRGEKYCPRWLHPLSPAFRNTRQRQDLQANIAWQNPGKVAGPTKIFIPTGKMRKSFHVKPGNEIFKNVYNYSHKKLYFFIFLIYSRGVSEYIQVYLQKYTYN